MRIPLRSLVLIACVSYLGACDEDPTPNPTPDGGALDGAPDVSPPDASSDVPAGETAPPPPADLDIALVRFNPNGTLDTTFGDNGVSRVDFGPGGSGVRDSLWSIARDAQNRLVLFGSRKGETPRIDSDRVVVRLTANGAIDTTFATMGTHTLNIVNLGDNVRNGIVQPDGKIVSAGYTAVPTGVGIQAANKVVLLRLNDDGKPDGTFGATGTGIASANPFVPADPLNTPWGMAEAYGAVFQSGKYVTAGYGRTASSGQVNMVSFRFTATGAFDNTWGTNGIIELDVAGDNDRGRTLAALPDDRILVLGSGIPATANIDAMAVMLQPDGKYDTGFATSGYKLYDFGRPDEAFFGAAVSPDGKWALGTGYRAGMVGGVMEDDDALLFLLPLGTGAGAEIAKAVPISDSDNDRFWSAAFDANNKAYGAGFVTMGGDSRMMVARFNTDGTLDTSFGGTGFVVHNVSVGTGTEEMARGMVVQSDGKVVVAGPFEKH